MLASHGRTVIFFGTITKVESFMPITVNLHSRGIKIRNEPAI